MNGLISRARNRLARGGLAFWLRPATGDRLIRLGSTYGGWWVPRSLLRPGTVAYCAGAGEDITFDLALHKAGCRVVTLDPTPRAIEHVRQVAPTDASFSFIPVGVWSYDGVLRFYAPKDTRHVSHSAVNLQETSTWFEAPVKTVRSLMTELRDDHIDLLKMDIEGAEYEVIESLLRDGISPSVVCVEFDQPQPLKRTVRAAAQLRAAGYTLAKIDGWNYTFTRLVGPVRDVIELASID
ncbi:FkbM family methyltransferase [Actinopolymorpha cephalotaxi]